MKIIVLTIIGLVGIGVVIGAALVFALFPRTIEGPTKIVKETVKVEDTAKVNKLEVELTDTRLDLSKTLKGLADLRDHVLDIHGCTYKHPAPYTLQ